MGYADRTYWFGRATNVNGDDFKHTESVGRRMCSRDYSASTFVSLAPLTAQPRTRSYTRASTLTSWITFTEVGAVRKVKRQEKEERTVHSGVSRKLRVSNQLVTSFLLSLISV